MLTTFLETGNGIVAINGLQPQPIAGSVNTTDALDHTIVTTSFPTNPSGTVVDGLFCGEVLIQGKGATGLDVTNNLFLVTIKRVASVTTVVNMVSIKEYHDAGFGAETYPTTVNADGNVNFRVNSGGGLNVQWTLIGILQYSP